MDTRKQIRIKNLKRDDLPKLWQELSELEFTELIERSSPKEISSLFGHMNSPAIAKVASYLSQSAWDHIIQTVLSNTINKILASCNTKTIKTILEKIDAEQLASLINKCNQVQKERLLDEVPEDKREKIPSRNHGASRTSNNITDYYLSSAFENSLKSNIIERIRDLEEKESILEKNYNIKENRIKERLILSEKQLSSIEQMISSKEEQYKEIELKLIQREAELNKKINELEEKQKKIEQERLEVKLPEYVDTAVNGLIKKAGFFDEKACLWNIQGGGALLLAIGFAAFALIYGKGKLENVSQESINWLLVSFLLFKGLIIVTLLCAWAKHAFNIANAYVHESLKRSDRMHAINFGKFYLEVYGNKVNQAEMKDIFENWNINTDSAFAKIKDSDFTPKHIEQVSTLIDSIRKIKFPDSK
ncbi:hypothetical protein I5R69_06260 [Serratia marcescens]|nr:hypothetical protein [Serratia marcescens]